MEGEDGQDPDAGEGGSDPFNGVCDNFSAAALLAYGYRALVCLFLRG